VRAAMYSDTCISMKDGEKKRKEKKRKEKKKFQDQLR
jgi:hypothetical protein